MVISWYFQIILLGCMLFVCEGTIIFEPKPNIGWEWTLGSNVTLVCTSNLSSGIHEFRYNSKNIFSCTGPVCTTDNDEGSFSFKSDSENGVYTWIINTVKMTYNQKEFECYDGLNSSQFTATVKGEDLTESNLQYDYVMAICIPAAIFTVIVIIIIIIRQFYAVLRKICCRRINTRSMSTELNITNL